MMDGTTGGGWSSPPPLAFPTLASAGYEACNHPRRGRGGHCLDCGAEPGGVDPATGKLTMVGGSLTHAREGY